jgi:IS30 family transposase
MDVYFADPGCPGQRGTNENTNGLIRDFFPKGTNFNDIPEEELKRVEKLLNQRPRKILNFYTPDEIYKNMVMSRSDPPDKQQFWKKQL